MTALNQDEKPYLVFPLGTGDSDPSTILAFTGTLAVPATAAGTWEHDRATVTIEFFKLNREDLMKERAQAVTEVYGAYQLHATQPNDLHRQDLQNKLSSAMAHTACRRAYYQCLRSDPAIAQGHYSAAVAWLAQYIATTGGAAVGATDPGR